MLLSLAFTGCKPTAPPPVADQTLRSLLGVSSLKGNYTLPKDENYYVLTALEFLDGKLVGRPLTQGGVGDFTVSGTISPELAWVKVGNTTSLTLINSTDSGGMTRAEAPFWEKLGGHEWGKAYSEKLSIGELMITGFAYSKEQRTPTQTPDPNLGALGKAILKYKYVGALAIKTFKTEAERDAFINSEVEFDKRP